MPAETASIAEQSRTLAERIAAGLPRIPRPQLVEVGGEEGGGDG